MQQRLGLFKVQELVTTNEMVKELKKLKHLTAFVSPMDNLNVMATAITDASHCKKDEIYGRSGLLNGMKMDVSSGSSIHPFCRSYGKQRKICYLSFGAKILVAADGDDRRYSVKMALISLFPKCKIRHQLLVNSKPLFETKTTLNHSTDYQIRKIVTLVRDIFDSNNLDVVCRIHGNKRC